MRAWLCMAVGGLVLCSGCTHLALERRTVKQASTLTDLQYTQVLDNVAMFCCNKDALAWHVKLSAGTVQITDQGSGSFTADITTVVGGDTRLMPSAGASRGVLHQWDVDPVVDAEELELLGLAYRKAVSPQDPDLVEKIDEAICELCLTYDILPDEKTLKRIFDRKENLAKGIVKDMGTVATQSKEIDDQITTLLADKSQSESMKAAKKTYLTELLKQLVASRIDLEMTLEAIRPILDGEPKSEPKTGMAPRLNILAGIGKGATGMRGAAGQASGAADYLLIALHRACDPSYLPPAWRHTPSERNIGLASQAGDKIKKLQELITEPKFNMPWLCCGTKKDMPKCACYVGHYCHCGQECFVWVMPDKLEVLRDFTLVILTLAPHESQDIFPRGAAFSPTVGRR